MINADMRLYTYFTLGDKDSYGQQTVNETPAGQIKMCIDITTQSIQDNINYSNAEYLGLTFAEVKDTYVIDYFGKKLKVLYINPMGRLNQVFMKTI